MKGLVLVMGLSLQDLQGDIEKVKEKKIRLEMAVKSSQERVAELELELKELGIDPANVDKEIPILEAALEEQHKRIKSILLEADYA